MIFMSGLVFSNTVGATKIAEITDPPAAHCYLSTRFAPVLDVAGDSSELLVGYQGAHLGRGIETRSDLDLAGDVCHSRDHAIVNRFVDV
jgi:hypothetical protein